MRSLFRDVVYAWRSLRKNRGFTTLAVLTIAVTIGANTIVFSIINASLLASLPYPEPKKLAVLHWREAYGLDSEAPLFFLLKRESRSFASMAAIKPFETGVNFAGAWLPQYVRGLRVSADFFATLGIAPVMGRVFLPEEDMPGGSCALILGHELWSREFGGDSAVLGRHVRISGQSCAIVGVMPRTFRSYPAADVWIPLQLGEATANPGHDYRIIARLRPETSRQQASQEIERLSRAWPNSRPGDEMIATGLSDSITSRVRSGLLILAGAVAFVLMIACTNLALLLVVRASARCREIAIRVAVGASKGRLFQVFMVESVLLTFMGALAGIILAQETLPWMISIIPRDIPLSADARIDGHVLILVVGISALTSLFFAYVPVAKMLRMDLNEALRQTSHTTSASLEQIRSARVLISVQTALTLILLAGSLLLLRSFLRLETIQLGFDPERIVVAQLSLASNRYMTTAATARALDEISERLQRAAGVESIAQIDGLPLERGLNLPVRPGEDSKRVAHFAQYRMISDNYFRAMTIPLIQGRAFSEGDTASAPPVAIVNQTLARQLWPGRIALGHDVVAGEVFGQRLSDRAREIVGVAEDIPESAIGQAPMPMVYIPLRQSPDNITAFVHGLFLTSVLIREKKVTNLEDGVRRSIAATDPDLSLAFYRPLPQVVSESLARPRFYAFLVSAFGTFALLLTVIGTYGLLSYHVSSRIREIGIRIAMGAKPSGVTARFTLEGIKPIAIGMLPGLAGSLLLTRMMRSLLYPMGSMDPMAILVAALLLLLVGALASSITALRATIVDLLLVLRSE
jgi:putative ABC transport system permease protein